jgi:hypothetical protein
MDYTDNAISAKWIMIGKSGAASKYFFVNRTIHLWNQLSAEALGTLSCKPSDFRKRVRKVIN